VADHVIVAHDGFVSLRAAGLYTPPEQTETQPFFETPNWAYDCARCGARASGLGARTLTCERCQAPVASRPDPGTLVLRPVAACSHASICATVASQLSPWRTARR